MQVSFWSNYHQLGTTYNMIAVAILTALEYRLRVLMAHAHFDRSALESAFVEKRYIRQELTDLSDTGIDALSRVIKFNKLEKDEISSYTTTILKNRLDLLFGTRSTNRDIHLSNMKDAIQLILQSAGRFYDLVFIDTAPGYSEITMKILEQSDLIVANLSQNIHALEEFLSECDAIREKTMLLLGKYDENSRYNLKALRKRFNLSQVQVVPYDTGYADACMDSKAVDFFIRNLPADKDDIHYRFIQGVRETAEAILTRLGIDSSSKRIERSRL